MLFSSEMVKRRLPGVISVKNMRSPQSVMNPPPLTYGTYSYAPASQAASRATPRWSVAGQTAALAASIAGLPAPSAWVRVGPPLSASGPSSASVNDWSVVPIGLHEPSLMTFPPPEVIVAAPPPSIAQAKAPPIALHHAVGQRHAGGCAERRHEDARRRAGRCDVVGERRVDHRQLPVGVEDAATVPRGRRVAAERAVDDVGVAEHAQAAGDIAAEVTAHGAAGDVDRAVEEPVDATARLVHARVVAHRAVGEVQRRRRRRCRCRRRQGRRWPVRHCSRCCRSRPRGRGSARRG